MRLLEYQGKELFNQYGIKTPMSFLASNIDDGKKGAQYLGLSFCFKISINCGWKGQSWRNTEMQRAFRI